MTNTSKNAACPCGSGKKYKRCHGMEDPKKKTSKSSVVEPPIFTTLIEKYCSEPILKSLGVLQLLPVNHGHEGQFEEMARLALLQRRQSDEREFASWQRLVATIEPMGYPDDPPTNAFTENAIFREGNYIVYPGIYLGMTEILNQLLESIFLQQNDLPKAFKKDVNDGVGILLFMSNEIAKGKNHTRYMYEHPDYDKITFPEYNSFIEDAGIITFEKEYLKKLCPLIDSRYEIINEFIVPLNHPDLENEDPDENPVSIFPLIENEEEIIVYMPTTIPNALIEFVYRKAHQHNCYMAVAELLQEKQFDNSCRALSAMKWVATDIKLPIDDLKLPIREFVFQFDNQKLSYLCYVDTIKPAESFPNRNGLDDRNKIVVEFLSSLSSEQKYQVLSLFIIAETGVDGFFSWNIPSTGNQTTMLRYGELNTIAYSQNANTLSLWKFAKTYTQTASRMRIMSIGGTMDAYAIYDSNKGSLVHSDDANPDGGMMMIVNGSSNEFYREVQKNRDEHAVLLYTGKVVGYTKVIRPKKYAAVFRDKFVSKEHRIVIEDYPFPIWVTNYQTEKNVDTTWAEIICEALAYWLQKMSSSLKEIFKPVTLIQFEIEVVIDQNLLDANEFKIKEVAANTITIKTEIAPPKLRLLIPFDFMYLVRNPDNEADKVLLKATLRGIVEYTTEAGKPINLLEEKINELIEQTLQPKQAKMILFSDPSRNVRLDNRHLPSIRYLQEANISYILDNLVSYLPKGHLIAKNITSKEEKIQLCDDVVNILLNQIKAKIELFDGELLLQWLIKIQEKCVQFREFREILIPAKIACFSSFDEEVKQLTNKGENLVEVSHSVRTLIEYVATKIPIGNQWPNYDDVDELLALTSQVTNWGASSEAMRFGLSDPEMGLLPSGRIGIDKSMEKDILEPYNRAKIQSDIFQYIERFEKNYLPDDKHAKEETVETKELDQAFQDEFGLTLTKLSRIIGTLINAGFADGKAWIKMEEQQLISLLTTKIEKISSDEIQIAINLLTLIERDHLLKAPNGFALPDVFSWHYTRPLSYIRRPLISIIDKKGNKSYYYGFRHLMMYIDNLYFLLFTGKLPERNSKSMASWIAGILHKKGKPYRDSVRDWFKSNTDFVVIDYEVTMKIGGHFEVEDNKGDIDVLAIDHKKKIIYPIECKNMIGARNIHEMKSEMDKYLGREGQEKKAKINKHVERDKWLQANKKGFNKFGIENPDEYQIKSFIMTADEIPLPYLKSEVLPLPIKSFVFLRKDGVRVLKDL